MTKTATETASHFPLQTAQCSPLKEKSATATAGRLTPIWTSRTFSESSSPERMTSTWLEVNITNTFRRFSAAIAPQFTKIDQLLLLQKIDYVEIQIDDIKKLERAVEQYVLRNAVQFEPVEFNLVGKDGYRLMQGILYPDEFVLQEGTKRVLAISLFDDEEDSTVIAKIKHPVSGIKVYDLVELGGTIQVQSATDELDKSRILTQSPSWAGLFTSCGCLFTKERWAVYKEENQLATITPISSFFNENSIRVQWNNCAENEVRLLAITFGLVQIVREAFPQITHIIKEFKLRHG